MTQDEHVGSTRERQTAGLTTQERWFQDEERMASHGKEISFSIQKGKDGLTVRGVQGTAISSVKFPLISAMLPLCPNDHLEGADAHKQDAGDGLGHEIEAEPSQNLVCIIRARHQLEETAARNAAHPCAWGAQHAQSPMGAEVADLHEVKEAHASVDEIARGRGVFGMVDKVGDVGGKAPVIDAVFEKIGERHGGVREAMDEECLQLALHIVDGPGDDSGKLDLFCPGGDVGVDC